ncbi:hypothetical protein PDE_05575 [Penicillium oxalicum 114-2]|uniref:Uncharacterized protein n=1 Tax=Penicillium oxalicum (strain 114-2 / CGMCC 5302) TaxID=933388 RepID=S8AWG3_PENO1|nr:hypothetical protein PDE_05575 [Penicillium oxalicum 114-2]
MQSTGGRRLALRACGAAWDVLEDGFNRRGLVLLGSPRLAGDIVSLGAGERARAELADGAITTSDERLFPMSLHTSGSVLPSTPSPDAAASPMTVNHFHSKTGPILPFGSGERLGRGEQQHQRAHPQPRQGSEEGRRGEGLIDPFVPRGGRGPVPPPSFDRTRERARTLRNSERRLLIENHRVGHTGSGNPEHSTWDPREQIMTDRGFAVAWVDSGVAPLGTVIGREPRLEETKGNGAGEGA